jgi:hypothetical protein
MIDPAIPDEDDWGWQGASAADQEALMDVLDECLDITAHELISSSSTTPIPGDPMIVDENNWGWRGASVVDQEVLVGVLDECLEITIQEHSSSSTTPIPSDPMAEDEDNRGWQSAPVAGQQALMDVLDECLGITPQGSTSIIPQTQNLSDPMVEPEDDWAWAGAAPTHEEAMAVLDECSKSLADKIKALSACPSGPPAPKRAVRTGASTRQGRRWGARRSRLGSAELADWPSEQDPIKRVRLRAAYHSRKRGKRLRAAAEA